jgi:GDP-4-dehydro-6-deoxy-D-mannose reductase
MASVYVKGFKMDIVITRSFNHFGPRQDDRFVLSSFAKQVAEIKKGNREPGIHVGDLSIVRDFTDVRDIVKAYLSLLDKGIAGEIYNVCSGTGRTIKDCLNLLIEIASVRCEIQKTEDLIRPIDNPVIVGDNTKIKELTGWSPGILFEVTLRDTYEYWMSKM